jgi:exosortase
MSKRTNPTVTPAVPLFEPARSLAQFKIGSRGRDATFVVLVLLSVAWCWQPLVTVISRSLKSADYEHYSHIILLPFLSAYLLYLNREAILKHVQPAPGVGILATVAGASMTWLAATTMLVGDLEYRLSLAMLGLVILWAGTFVMCYGLRPLKVGAFPFALLLFMVPLPPAVITAIIVFLQKGSAEASAVIFGLIGVPFFRTGSFVFALPGLTIQVAEECSGIRSSLALLISGLVMAYLLLRGSWARTALALVIVPLAIVKNAVRIVALSWLAIHVDPSFVTGSAVHRNGGIPVFLASLAILSALVWLLRRGESGRTT